MIPCVLTEEGRREREMASELVGHAAFRNPDRTHPDGSVRWRSCVDFRFCLSPCSVFVAVVLSFTAFMLIICRLHLSHSLRVVMGVDVCLPEDEPACVSV